ncbi:sugar nucleotide-binding protein [Patescibacteria group bacterium]|nr:sugar nucleotide-binding protein [Patescibacteria group bacterium]
MKILLFGSTGFIGSQLKEALLEKGHDIHDPRIEIRNFDEVKKTIEEVNPDYIINATGMTGKPNVDWCEIHPEETNSVNIDGSVNIARAANEKGIKVTQLSSGCVYEGDNSGKGFSEEDEANFFGSVYSRSRIECEKKLKEFPNVLQLRIRIPIMGKPNPKNLIDKMLLYPQMINITNSCTVMEDFVPAAIELIERGITGVMNMTNIGAMNHEEIMTMYKEIVDPSLEINIMSKEQEEELCKRRSNCVLSTDKRENLGVHMPPLKESLRRILKDYKQKT